MLNTQKTWPALAAVAALTLAACGGGGDAATGSSATPLSISGTAATGAAIAGGAVDVKCAAGTGTATTATNGSYSVSISGGALPCALRVTSGGTVLHSLVPAGAGATATANITPLTELLVANVAAGTPDSLFTNFDATAQGRVTSNAVNTAIAATLAALQGTVDLTGIDPLKDPLVAAVNGSGGNALDAILDHLGAALTAAQTTLADLSTAVATSTESSAPVLSELAPQAASCAALRSGTYRVLNPHETINDPAYATHLVTVDATALTITADQQAPLPLTAVANAACQFSLEGDPGIQTDLRVSPAGVIVALAPASVGGPVRTFFMIPEQTIALGKLAGTWNYMAYLRDAQAPALTPVNGSAVIDANGKFTSGSECTMLTCTDWAPADLPSDLTVNAAGGFDIVDGNRTGRVFAFLGGNGALSLFVLEPAEEGITVFSQSSALALPAVNQVTSFWDITVGNGNFAWAPTTSASVSDQRMTVTAADAGAQTFTRVRTSDQRVDTLKINDPRAGLRYRAPATGLSAAISMPMPGAGLVVSTTANAFNISVTHP